MRRAFAPPITVWATTRYSRTAPGGTGAAKCAGNYAAGFLGRQEAGDHGCLQVLWLDAAERRWIEELGGMNLNLSVIRHGTAMTPPLTHTLLPGITRDSILALVARSGVPVEQHRITLDDLCTHIDDGQIMQAFACGTAAVITPIGRIVTASRKWLIGTGALGYVTAQLRKELNIQYGCAADEYGWRRWFD